MKVSLNTVKQYTEVNLSVDELVNKVNSQLGGVEEIIDLGHKYKDAVIVGIVSAEPHPDADRLQVCFVDDGGVVANVPRNENGHIQVVCGAPNARAGILAVWLPPTSTVPASFDEKELFVLDARELRGVLSQGMLAAPDELAIGSGHDGILEIDPDEWSPKQSEIKPGANFAYIYGLDDTVLDIENKMFTHRPDCFGVLGVAREIAGIQHQQFKSPEWYITEPKFKSGDGLKLTVTNEVVDFAPRFMAVAIKNVEVKPSPLWLQCELVRLGAKPINNIVDVTNYVMLLTAQPTHAYDYDKLRGNTLGVRMAKKSETISLLNKKPYELDKSDIVIVDGSGPVGLAGIMGGESSEVSSATKNIVLECASFDMYTLRKSSMRHGIFTDALTRFNKGQSPLQNPYILELLITSVFDVAGGELASQLYDQSAELKPHKGVKLEIDFINERLGTKLSAKDAATLLTNVECRVDVKGKTLKVTPGFWRTDIELPEDVVEEVGRLYGFDHLPHELPARSITPAIKNPVLLAKLRVRHVLANVGANEVLTYSFVHENVLKRAEQNPDEAYRLSNALSPELQYYRLSLTPSLLMQIHPNIKAGHDEFVIFEIGKAHGKSEVDDNGLPTELGRIAGVYTASKKSAKARAGAAYFAARNYVEAIGGSRGFTYDALTEAGYQDHTLFQQMCAPYDPQRSAVIHDGQNLVGIVGEFKASVTKAYKLPDYSAGFELFVSAFVQTPVVSYRPLSRFPSVTQDISLKVSHEKSFGDVWAVANEAIASCAYTINMTPVAIYSAENDSNMTITLRLNVTSNDKTLSDKEVSTIINTVATLAAQKLGAEQV